MPDLDDREELIQYYCQRAPEYEQIYYRDMPERRREIDDEIARLQELCKDKSVLDIPCGTGYWTAIMQDSADQIVAADLSREMLAEASGRIRNEKVSLVQADINKPPFATGAFDLVALGFWLSHHPRQHFVTLFESLKRLIKPAGKIWMIENNPPAEGDRPESFGSDKHGNNFKERFLDSGKRFVIMKNYFSEEEIRELLSANFRIERLTYGKYYWSAVLLSPDSPS
ncbi:MAG: class I SAM-dependent methyltransferase [bacterium]|nr:class I SAM-dependent methyltransferase [bacterium]